MAAQARPLAADFLNQYTISSAARMTGSEPRHLPGTAGPLCSSPQNIYVDVKTKPAEVHDIGGHDRSYQTLKGNDAEGEFAPLDDLVPVGLSGYIHGPDPRRAEGAFDTLQQINRTRETVIFFIPILLALLRGNSMAMPANFGILLVRSARGPAGEQRDEGMGIAWMGPAGGCPWTDVEQVLKRSYLLSLRA